MYEHLDSQLVLTLRWGKLGLPYPHPLPSKIHLQISLFVDLYFGVVFCRLFSFKKFVLVTVKNMVRVRVSSRVRVRVRLGLGSGLQ